MKKILSLDGGGSWAMLEAMALGELYGYTTPGDVILSKFDLAVSNSGGSIILAALALKYTPQQMINLLNDETKRKTIFVEYPLGYVTGVEKYNTVAKLQGLRNLFGVRGDQTLDTFASSCNLLICTFDYDRLRETFFRSFVNSKAAAVPGSPQPTLAEAVHASTNAPIKYFDAPAQFNSPAFAGRRFWDGAVGGYNNPVMAGVTEMLANGCAASDLRILSIGTANVFLPLPPAPWPVPGAYGQNPLLAQINSSNLAHDTLLMACAILDDPPDTASYEAHVITGGAVSHDPAAAVTNGNLVRLNPWIQPVNTPTGWAAPSLLAHAGPGNSVPGNYSTDTEVFEAVANLSMDAIDQSDVDLVTTLGRAWIAGDAPNQSVQATPDLQTLIGHKTFALAVAQARTLGLA